MRGLLVRSESDAIDEIVSTLSIRVLHELQRPGQCDALEAWLNAGAPEEWVPANRPACSVAAGQEDPDADA